MSDDAPERIRFCLSCSEAMPFEARLCEACGHENPPVPGSVGESSGDGRPQAPCDGCGEAFVATGLFCPHCGRERVTPRVGAAPVVPAEPPGARGLERLAWGLTLGGPLLVAAAVAITWVIGP